jgi:hypothetical protein
VKRVTVSTFNLWRQSRSLFKWKRSEFFPFDTEKSSRTRRWAEISGHVIVCSVMRPSLFSRITFQFQ